MKAELRAELETALRLQKAGRLGEAEAIYGKVCAIQPGNSDAWHLLGVVRCQVEDFAGAIDAIGKAITIDACQAVYFNNFGAALQGAKKCRHAIAAYRAALQLDPEYLDARVNLVRSLNQLRQFRGAWEEAEGGLRISDYGLRIEDERRSGEAGARSGGRYR